MPKLLRNKKLEEMNSGNLLVDRKAFIFNVDSERLINYDTLCVVADSQ